MGARSTGLKALARITRPTASALAGATWLKAIDKRLVPATMGRLSAGPAAALAGATLRVALRLLGLVAVPAVRRLRGAEGVARELGMGRLQQKRTQV